MDPDEEDDEDELASEAMEGIVRARKRLASMPRRFSGANWQTLSEGALASVAPSYLVSNVSHSGQASYVNASQLLQTTTSG